MVGTAHEVVHRTLKKFERDDLLRVAPTHFVLLDTEKLDDIARQEIR